jgi:hypothetical protein
MCLEFTGSWASQRAVFAGHLLGVSQALVLIIPRVTNGSSLVEHPGLAL